MSGTKRIPYLIGALGTLLLAVLVGEAVAIAVATEAGITPLFGVSVATTAPFILVCLYAGRWLHRSEIHAERYRRVAGWVLGGMIGFVVLNSATILLLLPINAFVLAGWLRWAASLGAGTGVIIGIVEARAIQRAVLAERQRVRADEAETREELLAYLHNLLRHKVRNAVNAIDGHASLLAGGDDANSEYLEAIQRQTGELHAITREVRTFLEASGAEADLRPVDLCEALRLEVEALDEAGVYEFDLDCGGDVTVRADELIHRALRNLLVNVTVHEDGTDRRVRIGVEAEPEWVTVRIEPDGAALPDSDDDDLFDLNHGGTPEEGLGLPLGRILVERYGGTVSLTNGDAGQAQIDVELPRADRTAETPAPVVASLR